MRIDWTQTAGGLDIAAIRDILIRAASRDGTITLQSLASVHPAAGPPGQGARRSFSQPKSVVEAARHLLRVLAASDMIGPTDVTSYPGHPTGYGLTPVALSLTNASRLKRILRTKALQAVQELRAAAAAINADPTMLHDVVELAVYGSFLTDVADLGDVDVAYGLEVRESGDQDAFEAAHPKPYGFSSRWNRHSWATAVVERRLRVRRCISLSGMHSVKLLGCPMKMLLPEERDIAPSAEWSPFRAEVILRDDGGDALTILDQAIHTRDAERRRRTDEFRDACLAGSPPPDADPKHVRMVLLVSEI